MLDPGIWEDEHFGKLSDKAKILFIACISNADDEGRLSANPANLRAMAFRFEEKSIQNIKKLCEEISANLKNFHHYNIDGSEYIQLTKWNDYQTQREERIRPSKYPKPTIMGQASGKCQANVGELSAQDKLSKDKLSKDKGADAPSADIYPFLKNKDFASLWVSWLEVRKHKRIPNTLRAQELALSKLHAWGESKAREALKQAIEKGWRGIFEPKDYREPVKPDTTLKEWQAGERVAPEKVSALLKETVRKIGGK